MMETHYQEAGHAVVAWSAPNTGEIQGVFVNPKPKGGGPPPMRDGVVARLELEPRRRRVAIPKPSNHVESPSQATQERLPWMGTLAAKTMVSDPAPGTVELNAVVLVSALIAGGRERIRSKAPHLAAWCKEHPETAAEASEVARTWSRGPGGWTAGAWNFPEAERSQLSRLKIAHPGSAGRCTIGPGKRYSE